MNTANRVYMQTHPTLDVITGAMNDGRAEDVDTLLIEFEHSLLALIAIRNYSKYLNLLEEETR